MSMMTHLLVMTSPRELVLVAHHGVADLVKVHFSYLQIRCHDVVITHYYKVIKCHT